jgi:outer membrane murein-binding lipoprotein Lpp
MRYQQQRLTLVCVLLSSLLVTGCSRAPSAQDIEDAYRQEVEPVNAISRQISGDALIIQVNSVTKKSCEKVNDTNYLCQVDIDSTLPFVGKRNTATELTLAKQDDQWKIVRVAR